MRCLLSIAGALIRLLDHQTPPGEPLRTDPPEPLDENELAMLRAGLTRTRMGFRSKSSVLITLFAAVLGLATAVGSWIWAERAGTRSDAAVRWALALGASGVSAIAVGFLIAWATTWRPDDNSSFHLIRRLGWWCRVVVPHLYSTLVVCYAGLTLLVGAYGRSYAEQRDFEVLAAVGISVTSAGLGIAFVAVGQHFHRRRSLLSSIEHHVRLLENGIRTSLEANAELFARLRIGLGSAGRFAVPVVDPAKCDQALFLYSRVQEPADLLSVLREARDRLVRRPRSGPTRQVARAMLRQLTKELRQLSPAMRPGPVQVAAFRLLLGAGSPPIADQLESVTPIWKLACRAECDSQVARCLRLLDEAFTETSMGLNERSG
jgi:hypothetical protein